MTIAIRHAAAFEDDGVRGIAFSETEGAGTSYVLLTVALNPDEQDRRLGLDGLRLEYNDQSQSGYDLVRSVQTKAARVGLNLVDPNPISAASELKLDCSDCAGSIPEIIDALGDMCRQTGIPFERQS